MQRVTGASVGVDGEVVANIGLGMVIMLGFCRGDTLGQATRLYQRLSTWRVFRDDSGKMNRSIGEVGGALLVIPQFTLYADFSGRRPHFSTAMPATDACVLFDSVIADWSMHPIPIQTGVFGADMAVTIHNQGPVTWWWDD